MADLRTIEFNEVARYSAWPERLLGSERAQIRRKTEQEVLREYNKEKWGELLEFAGSSADVTLEKVEDYHVDANALSPYFDGGKFCLATERQSLDRYLDLYTEALAPHVAGASCLVELGAGFGSKIMRLSRRKEFGGVPLIAGEFTENGQKLLKVLAEREGISVQVGHCDFRNLNFSGLNLPQNALIFTSYSVHYVPELQAGFVDALLALKPKAIVNFEPCYEYYPLDSIHGLMCRRYVELNDYVRNLGALLQEAADRREISLRVRKNVLGSNPFLPISVFDWTPLKG